VLAVSGRESAPVLELVEGSFDDVAVLVVLGVEADRPAAAGTFVLAVGSLVVLLRDHDLHAPGPENVAVGLGRVGLVPAQCVGGGPRPARAAARNAELVQQHWQCRGITRVAGRQDQDQRQPTAVDQRMGLGCQATPGTTDGVIVRFVPATRRFLVIRPSPLCER
jgi:hypothetical protein